MLFTSVALLLAGASSVRAHGYVQSVNIGGKDYPGWLPFESPYATPVPQTVERKVADDGPSESYYCFAPVDQILMNFSV